MCIKHNEIKKKKFHFILQLQLQEVKKKKQ